MVPQLLSITILRHGQSTDLLSNGVEDIIIIKAIINQKRTLLKLKFHSSGFPTVYHHHWIYKLESLQSLQLNHCRNVIDLSAEIDQTMSRAGSDTN